MSLLDCLIPRTIAVPDMRRYKTRPSKRKADKAYYWRHRDRLKAAQLAYYHRTKHGR